MVRSPFKKGPKLSGIYSGNWIMDPQGTWNGSSFTITVNDSLPHFFHAITPWFSTNCALIGNLSTAGEFPANVDEVFALNPVLNFRIPLMRQSDSQTLEGYRKDMITQNNGMSYKIFPAGGQLFVKTTLGYETGTNTTDFNNSTCASPSIAMCQSIIPVNQR
jgi:hypothetical protein